jgi:two-component system, chemotaxis family, sensor kinase Cph1
VFPRMFVLFGVFIVGCGTTHLLAVVTLWAPIYRFEGLAKVLTAAASLLTAVLLFRLIPQILRIPSVSQLHEQIALREVAEQELQTLNHDLEQRVEDRTAQLTSSNNDLRQFAYAAAHDLQEPLRNVANSLEFFERFHAGELTEEAEEMFRVALEGSRRAIHMIKGLLKYSRVGDEAHVAMEFVSASAAVGVALANLKDMVDATSARITVDPLPNVQVSDVHLIQLFQNLLSNALKYRTPDVPPEIQIAVRKKGTWWEFSVQDNGIGFNPEYSEKIFDLFKRLHRDEYDGNGIGLALCQRIVTAYGGRIWANSQPGEGATFRFTLPTERLMVRESELSTRQ